MRKINWNEVLIVTSFVIAPLLVSLVSISHVNSLFFKAYTSWESKLLAVSCEVMAIAILIVGPKLYRVGIVATVVEWLITFSLIVILSFSNVFYAWEKVGSDTIRIMSELFSIGDMILVKRIYCMFVGSLVTLLSMSFIPLYVQYRIMKEKGFVVEREKEESLQSDEPRGRRVNRVRRK